MIAALTLPALGLVLLTSLVILGSSNWRLRLFALGVQYVGVFILVADSWPPALAVVKLVAGFMAGVVLGISRGRNRAATERPRWPTEWLFRGLAAALVVLAVASIIPLALAALPAMQPAQALAGLTLAGMGLLTLGFSQRTLPVLLSLLTFLAGFEILYAVVEESTLVAGLLALVNLGIAMAGSYLMDVEAIEETG